MLIKILCLHHYLQNLILYVTFLWLVDFSDIVSQIFYQVNPKVVMLILVLFLVNYAFNGAQATCEISYFLIYYNGINSTDISLTKYSVMMQYVEHQSFFQCLKF